MEYIEKVAGYVEGTAIQQVSDSLPLFSGVSLFLTGTLVEVEELSVWNANVLIFLLLFF